MTAFEPYPGNMQWFEPDYTMSSITMDDGYFALGGNKQSPSDPPVFWCKPSDLQIEVCFLFFFPILVNDIFMSLTDSTFYYSPDVMGNLSAIAFAYISARNDSLKLDPSIGFAPPMQQTIQAKILSFVNNDTDSKPPT